MVVTLDLRYRRDDSIGRDRRIELSIAIQNWGSHWSGKNRDVVYEFDGIGSRRDVRAVTQYVD